MPSLAGLVGPVAAVTGARHALALARGANPRTNLAGGSFEQQLDLARRAETSDDLALQRIEVNGASSLEEVRAAYYAATAEFDARFRGLLREHGIDIGDGVVLEADAEGHVKVLGEHSQKQAIEALFDGDLELRTLFMQLDRQASLLRAADLAADFARLQAEAPSEAATQVQQLVGSSLPKFSLVLGPQDLATRFS